MIDESVWQELEAHQQTPGRSTRRLYPDSPHDIQVSVTHPALRRMLLLGTDARTADTVRQEIQQLLYNTRPAAEPVVGVRQPVRAPGHAH